MKTTHATDGPLDLLRRLTLPDVEARIAELDAEAESLRVLRRSLLARERARSNARPVTGEGGAR